MEFRGANVSNSVVFERLMKVVGDFLSIDPLAISAWPPLQRSEEVALLERWETRSDIRGKIGEWMPGTSLANFGRAAQGHGALDADGAADEKNIRGVQQAAKDQRGVQVLSYEEDSARLFTALTSAESVSRLNSLLSYYGLPDLDIVAVRITCGQGYADVATPGDNTSAPGGPAATGSCVPCSRESYKENADDSDCVACPEGVRTSIEGSISAAACKVANTTNATADSSAAAIVTAQATAAMVSTAVAAAVGSAVAGAVAGAVGGGVAGGAGGGAAGGAGGGGGGGAVQLIDQVQFMTVVGSVGGESASAANKAFSSGFEWSNFELLPFFQGGGPRAERRAANESDPALDVYACDAWKEASVIGQFLMQVATNLAILLVVFFIRMGIRALLMAWYVASLML